MKCVSKWSRWMLYKLCHEVPPVGSCVNDHFISLINCETGICTTQKLGSKCGHFLADYKSP